MSLYQGFVNLFNSVTQTNTVLKNLDNETKKIYTNMNSFMASNGHAHTANGSDGAAINDASTTVKGIVELATDAEMTTGTSTVLVITPANAKVELDKKAAKGANTDITSVAGPFGVGVPSPQATLHSAGSTILGTVVSTTAADNMGNEQVCIFANSGILFFKVRDSAGAFHQLQFTLPTAGGTRTI